MTNTQSTQRPPYELILRVLQGRANADERSRLDEWRAEAPEHEAWFRAVSRIWAGVGALDPGGGLSLGPPPTARELVGPAEADAEGGQERREGVRRRGLGSSAGGSPPERWHRWVPRAAAAVLLLASGYLTAGLVNQQEEAVSLTLAATEFRTGQNDMTTVRLTDGTVVRLAPESRLRMAGGGGSREVWLEGRAFFAVRPSRDTHFSVRTPSGEVVVLGTRFDVEARDRSMQVVVVEGRVALSDGVVDVELEANQMTRIQNGAAFQVIEVPHVYRTLSWMGRSLVFQATPLIEVARELEQRFDVEVHVADPLVRERTVTAWFTDEEFEDVMTVICRAVQARCSISADWARVEADGRR